MRLVLQLLQCPAVRPIALQQLCEVWKHHHRVFPKLSAALMQPPADFEERLSVALVVRTVCETRAQQGLDLVQLLSRMVCLDPEPCCVSVGLQALGFLCQSGAMDFEVCGRVALVPRAAP